MILACFLGIIGIISCMFFQKMEWDPCFNFKVCRNVVIKALCCLRKHNVSYKTAVINIKRVSQLPEDYYLGVCSISIKERNKSSDAFNCGAVEDKENNSLIKSPYFLPTHTNKNCSFRIRADTA